MAHSVSTVPRAVRAKREDHLGVWIVCAEPIQYFFRLACQTSADLRALDLIHQKQGDFVKIAGHDRLIER